MNPRDIERLYAALETLRLVEAGRLPTEENAYAFEALSDVIRDLETLMSDHFDLYVT